MKQRKRSPSRPKLPGSVSRSPREQSVALSVQQTHAAGIDVHSDMHMVCVPADSDPEPVRRFGANTCDLQAIADWLKQCGVTTVALESTGVYWIPLLELLEARGFEVWLVEPGQMTDDPCRAKATRRKETPRWTHGPPEKSIPGSVRNFGSIAFRRALLGRLSITASKRENQEQHGSATHLLANDPLSRRGPR